MNHFLLFSAVVLLSACASPRTSTTGASGHPANPDSPTAARPTPMPSARDSPDRLRQDSAAPRRDEPGAAAAGSGAVYACPMHPAVTSSDPDARCPECGMKINKKVTPSAAENPR